uniref:Vacuolar-sorting protein SNF8 n=1 Tax=Lygus hesperus TaxID=30085 RepID=A0A0A9YAV4_LYGHE
MCVWNEGQRATIADPTASHMRRRPGIVGLRQKQETQQRYAELGEKLTNEEEANITHQLEIFRKNMIEFASKHRDRINKNPYYRAQFHHLCRKVGVDPLASRKGFWSELLGIGDFYYELGIQVIDICAEKQKIYGGLIPLLELTQR